MYSIVIEVLLLFCGKYPPFILTTIIRDSTYFTQCSEQIKIEYFCTECSVKVFNESVLHVS